MGGQTVISEKRTPATAPLSLARVKMSVDREPSVEFASQETSAIQGVMANNRHYEQGTPGTSVECECTNLSRP